MDFSFDGEVRHAFYESVGKCIQVYKSSCTVHVRGSLTIFVDSGFCNAGIGGIRSPMPQYLVDQVHTWSTKYYGIGIEK